ncbi:MAG: hypothetical protein IKX51_01325, partial [Bacteroidales bacterium]|nr:hypothetical protein [Bacteroidales bacterium]
MSETTSTAGGVPPIKDVRHSQADKDQPEKYVERYAAAPVIRGLSLLCPLRRTLLEKIGRQEHDTHKHHAYHNP